MVLAFIKATSVTSVKVSVMVGERTTSLREGQVRLVSERRDRNCPLDNGLPKGFTRQGHEKKVGRSKDGDHKSSAWQWSSFGSWVKRGW
jgi:hypothetical protein